MLVREYLPALRYGAKILPSEILGGGLGPGSAPTFGNIYYVMKSTDSYYGDFYADYYTKYTDGTASIYNTIQDAVDAATDGRGDVIIVAPGKWTEEVYIVSKRGLRVLGAGFGTGGTDTGAPRIRASDATTHYPFTTTLGRATNGACFHVLSRNVEISGFYLDGGGNYAGIYCGGGLYGGITGYTTENASGCYFHNNSIRGGSEGAVGLFLDGARFEVVVENNIFERWTGAAIEMGPGNASNECCIIRNNHFIADNGGYGVDIYGSTNSSLGCQICQNFFGDRGSHAFANTIYSRTGAAGVTTVMGNYHAATNMMNILATDIHSGNYRGTANATEVYVDED